MARNAQNLLDMAADILWTNATQSSTGLKNLVYEAKIQAGQRSMLIALVNGAHKERDQLFACAEQEGFLAALPVHLQPTDWDHDKLSFEIQVVLYECLLGSRRVRGTSPLVDFCKTRKKNLQMTLAQRRKEGAAHSYVPPVRMPRYVRVNHLLLSIDQATEYVESYGYKRISNDQTGDGKRQFPNNYTSVVKPMTYMVDPCIPSLLVLPPNTSMHGDTKTQEGGLILQDRSSCLTALALNPPPNAHCLDTCSSPGNKTLHLASIMMEKTRLQGGHNTCAVTGSITALERSPNRYKTLCQRVQKHGASGIITPMARDFMTVDTAVEFPNVTHILIDPSCSGSGLVSTFGGARSPSEFDEYDRDGNVLSIHNHRGVTDSVAALAREQEALILHAMTLPKANAIAYSTCSIHRVENEDVVLAVLAARRDWKLVPAIPEWPHRGLDFPAYADIKDFVCRASLDEDGTNGFFVARFEKLASNETDSESTNKKANKPKNIEGNRVGEDVKIYKQVKKATKKLLKKVSGKSLKCKEVRKALKEKLGVDKKKLRQVLGELIARERKIFILEGKRLRLFA